MIRAIGLVKRFGGRAAVDRVSFDIPRGQVVGLLGPNGAGKTTTMRLLTAYLPPDEGRAEILGRDAAEEPLEVRRSLGYLPENNPLYADMEVTDSLHYAGRLRGLEDGRRRAARVKEVVRLCGLQGAAGERVAELSKGYRQRLGLAQAIIHDPAVLILDEPTSGLDPNQVLEVRALIKELKKEKTVLLSTHILPEVTASCDRVIIIHAGRIVADGAPGELGAAGRASLRVSLKAPPAAAAQALARLPGVAGVERAQGEGASFDLRAEEGADPREALFELAAKRHWPILALTRERPSLEEVFRSLTLTP